MNILLIDESRAMRRVLRRTLRDAGFGRHTITEADNGTAALQAIKASTPDVVMSDWDLPSMKGIELLEALNNEGIRTSFGFVTAESSAEMQQRANKAGAKFMIGIPFTPQSFHSALDRVLAH